jgi:hypothetical protein
LWFKTFSDRLLAISGLQGAETAYTTAITHKDSQIQAAEAAIQVAVKAKGVTASAFEAITRKCAPHMTTEGRASYHL